MRDLISGTIWQLFLLLFLIPKDKNDGEKELFKDQPWKALDVIIIVLSMNAFFYAEYLLFQFHFIFIDSFFKSIRLFAYHLFLFFLLIALFKFRFKNNFRLLGFTKNNLGKMIAIGFSIALVNFLLTYFLYLSFGNTVTYARYTAKGIKSLENLKDYMAYIFMVVIFAPIIEESICRGIFYSPFRKKYGAKKAVLITALLFSFSHYWIGFMSSLICGISIGILYEKTESLISTIVAHGISNLFIISTVFYALKG